MKMNSCKIKLGSLFIWRAPDEMIIELYIVLQRRRSTQPFFPDEVQSRTLCVHRETTQLRNVYDFDIDNSLCYTLLDDELPSLHERGRTE